MTDLQWTDEPPEEEGYFWYSERPFGPKVCHFSPDGIGGGTQSLIWAAPMPYTNSTVSGLPSRALLTRTKTNSTMERTTKIEISKDELQQEREAAATRAVEQAVEELPDWCSKEQLATIIRAFQKMCEVDAVRNDDPDVDFPEDTRWWMADAWQFAFWQGLRKQEVVAIRVGGVDLNEMQMVVGDESFVPKGRREDVIPLSGPAAEIAREWDVSSRHDGERLFRHAGADKLSKAFTQAREAAREGEYKGEELPEDAQLESGEGLTLHSLRHGRAIDLIRQRRHVVYVSQYLRHSSLEVTREYLQVVPRHLHDEIRQLDEEGIEL